MNQRPSARCAWLLALPVMAACSAPAPSAVGRSAQAITSGTLDDADTSAVLIVAKVAGGTGFCSGVVVSPHVVLTAGHCSAPDAAYTIFLGTDYADTSAHSLPENLVTVAEHHAHPTYDSLRNVDDIGVLITKAPIGRPAAALNRRPLAKSDVGQAIRIVGFGRTSGSAKAAGKRTVATTTLAAFDEDTLSVQGVPKHLSEDSGGPTFMRRDGADVVVGIHFIVDSATCDGEGLDARVDRYADFIDEQVSNFDPPIDAGIPEDAAPIPESDGGAELRADPPPPSGCAVARARSETPAFAITWLLALAGLLGGRRRERPGSVRCY